MLSLLRRLLPFIAVSVLAFPAGTTAQIPERYGSAYADTVAAARMEGRVVVHATTDVSAATPLNRAFEAAYPGVKVEYRELESPDLYARFVAEQSTTRVADLLWSSAMDLQMKLVNDGHAATYASPEAPALPEWAVWRTEAYGTTVEPVGFLYNERALAPTEAPQSHADFARLIAEGRDRFRGKVITYDIERAGVGFLFATQDSRASPAFWALAKALGDAEVRLESSTSAMTEAIGSGSAVLGYNVIGSYAMARARLDPSIAFVLPKDYTLVLSRVAFIAKRAPHPNAARLYLDFLLSQRGQSVLATKSGLLSVRNDLPPEQTAAGLAKTLGGRMRPIGVGPGLLVYLDRAKRQEFVRQWRQAVASRR